MMYQNHARTRVIFLLLLSFGALPSSHGLPSFRSFSDDISVALRLFGLSSGFPFSPFNSLISF
jgi:hypothetical protein